MLRHNREQVIERVGRFGRAEQVLLTVPAADFGLGWSLFPLRSGRPSDPVRQGFLTREFGGWTAGRFYVQNCDLYGCPERPLLRPFVMHGESSPAFDGPLEALAAFLGHIPNSRLRYARD